MPLEDRSASRLLVLPKGRGEVQHRVFRELPDLLEPGDLLVLNNTRVTALRLFGRKPSGGEVELLLLRPVDGLRFVAMARPGRRLQPGARVEFENGLVATVEHALDEGRKQVRFDEDPALQAKLESLGRTPLPPYIHEPIADPSRYQTVYARTPGSAAAPTAGLHFTDDLFSRLKERGIGWTYVTLDVSLDTFRPVQVEKLEDHQMHGEVCSIPPETAEAIRTCRGRVIAVGTTSARTLEACSQGPRNLVVGERETTLFIRPGYEWQTVDALVTNFHMPRTTLLAMVSALCGRERLLDAYQTALGKGYRFLSFGDAMIVL